MLNVATKIGALLEISAYGIYHLYACIVFLCVYVFMYVCIIFDNYVCIPRKVSALSVTVKHEISDMYKFIAILSQ